MGDQLNLSVAQVVVPLGRKGGGLNELILQNEEMKYGYILFVVNILIYRKPFYMSNCEK